MTNTQVTQELRALGAGKAVPKHVAPAVLWKWCSGIIGPILGQAIRTHFQRGKTGQLKGDWKDTHVVWLAKPGKPADCVKNLRPIGLQCPTSKVLSGVLPTQLLDVLSSSRCLIICLSLPIPKAGEPQMP